MLQSSYLKIVKVTGIIVGIVVLLPLVLIISAYIFAFLQKRTFVNGSLALTNNLFIPKLLEPSMQNGTKVFSLSLQEGNKDFIGGKQTSTWGINGNYLGP